MQLDFHIADLARMRADEAKLLCRRRILAVASESDQLNHTPEEAAIFKPWVASMRAHHASLRASLALVGAYWNPLPVNDQAGHDAKDEGYNAALALIDIQNSWPEFPGWETP